MRRSIAIILFAVAFFGPLPAQAQQAKQLSLKVSQEKSVRRGGFRVKFLELLEDSRCPADAVCVWAGNAKIKIRVTKDGRSKVLELNSNLGDKAPAFGGYTYKIKELTPYPRSNIQTRPKDYVAVIEVAKAGR